MRHSNFFRSLLIVAFVLYHEIMSVDVASMDVAYNILSAYFAPSRAPNLLAQCFFPFVCLLGDSRSSTFMPHQKAATST